MERLHAGRDDDQPSAPEWMCTFADMMSLLLYFFVLLFSISSIDKTYIQAQGSYAGRLVAYLLPSVENIPIKISGDVHLIRRKNFYAQQELVRDGTEDTLHPKLRRPFR